MDTMQVYIPSTGARAEVQHDPDTGRCVIIPGEGFEEAWNKQANASALIGLTEILRRGQQVKEAVVAVPQGDSSQEVVTQPPQPPQQGGQQEIQELRQRVEQLEQVISEIMPPEPQQPPQGGQQPPPPPDRRAQQPPPRSQAPPPQDQPPPGSPLV